VAAISPFASVICGARKAGARSVSPEEAGIHRTNLGGIQVARRNPSLRNLIRIARALGVPMVRLFEPSPKT
jgi:hypothetical protein